jgi:acyl transferase domain-containing protein
MLWPDTEHKKRVSINSFGYGGANAHCILERFEGFQKPSVQQDALLAINNDCKVNEIRIVSPKAGVYLLPFSGHNNAAVNGNISNILKSFKSTMESSSLQDLAYTLSSGRSALSHRAFAIVDGENDFNVETCVLNYGKVTTQPMKVSFVFTGWYKSNI